MPRSERIHRWRLVAIVLASLAFCLFVIAFHAGLGATPWDTRDSTGATMEFNDRLSAEHYAIVLGNMSPSLTLEAMGFHEWLLLGCHVLAIGLILSWGAGKWMIGFATAQVALFPWGLLGIVFLPVSLFDILFVQSNTRESFVDIPSVAWHAHGFWLPAVFFVAWRMLRFSRSKRSRDAA